MSQEIYAIHEAFSATEHGQALAERVRYERYNLAQVSNEEWVRLLGSDVNNLTHMPLTRGLTLSYIKATEAATPGYFTDEEKTLLELGAIIHDQGEAITGDISFGDKTEADELEEQRVLIEYFEAFCPGISEETAKLVVRARDEVVTTKETKIGQAFNAIERAGYLRTALRAADHLERGTAGESTAGLRWIVADVFSNQILALTQYAESMPAISGYLINRMYDIEAAYRLVQDSDFDNYGPEQGDVKRDQFAAGQAAWYKWRQANV